MSRLFPKVGRDLRATEVLGPVERRPIVDAVSRAEIGTRLNEHLDRVEGTRVHGVMKSGCVRVKPGGAVDIHVDPEIDQRGEDLRVAVEGRGSQRDLPVGGARRGPEVRDVVRSSGASRRRKGQRRAAFEKPLGRRDLAVREGREKSPVGIRAGIAEHVDELALHPALARDPSRAHQAERVIDLLSKAALVMTFRRVQDRACHVGDVLRQPAVADRVLRDEPEEVRPPEIPLPVVEAIANQLGVRGQETFERPHVAGIDGRHSFPKERVEYLGVVHDEGNARRGQGSGPAVGTSPAADYLRSTRTLKPPYTMRLASKGGGVCIIFAIRRSFITRAFTASR